MVRFGIGHRGAADINDGLTATNGDRAGQRRGFRDQSRRTSWVDAAVIVRDCGAGAMVGRGHAHEGGAAIVGFGKMGPESVGNRSEQQGRNKYQQERRANPPGPRTACL